MAGGAGKSTTARLLMVDALANSTFVNADVLAQGLTGFTPSELLAMDDRTFAERWADWRSREAALNQAVREAVLQHAVVGRSVPTWRDGQVVWLTPDEIFALYGLELRRIEPAPGNGDSDG